METGAAFAVGDTPLGMLTSQSALDTELNIVASNIDNLFIFIP